MTKGTQARREERAAALRKLRAGVFEALKGVAPVGKVFHG
jgi:hypothetical protein